MRSNQMLKFLFALWTISLSQGVQAQGDDDLVPMPGEQPTFNDKAPAVDPAQETKTQAWTEQCMKDSGWLNEDGMAFCSCIAYQIGTTKVWKDLKKSKAVFDCQSKLPTKVAECVQEGGGSYEFCHCLSDKLTEAVDRKAWLKTKAGSDAAASCKK
jgi:hypothetical protein